MKYVLDLLQRDLNIELRALAAAKELTRGNGFSMDDATQGAFDVSKNLAEERIPQLQKAIKSISLKQKPLTPKVQILEWHAKETPKLFFKTIPIVISQNSDTLQTEMYRVEIPDNYEDFTPCKYKDINFEDCDFHFRTVSAKLFHSKKEAIKCAEEININHLSNKANIYLIK